MNVKTIDRIEKAASELVATKKAIQALGTALARLKQFPDKIVQNEINRQSGIYNDTCVSNCCKAALENCKTIDELEAFICYL